MQGIVYVKQPFHELIDFFAMAALSIVHHNNRYRQNNCHLHKSIYLIERKEIHNRIHGNIENHPKHLLFEISAVCAKGQNAKAGDAAPIAGKGDQADQQDQKIAERLFLLCANLSTSLLTNLLSITQLITSPCKKIKRSSL